MTMDAGRAPVSTFDQAVWWLVCHSTPVADFIAHNHGLDAMPLEAVLVCDLFWCTREQLRVRLVKAFREVNLAASPAPLRRYARNWVRA